jgi:hypothetical protein
MTGAILTHRQALRYGRRISTRMRQHRGSSQYTSSLADGSPLIPIRKEGVRSYDHVKKCLPIRRSIGPVSRYGRFY